MELLNKINARKYAFCFYSYNTGIVEYNENDDMILTIRNYGIVPWENPKDPLFNDWKVRSHAHSNYGFVRATTDKKGSVLSYIRASKIIPDPFPSKSHVGEWYAFEEYNVKQIKDFEIALPRWFDDKIGIRWAYDANQHCYTLIIPNAFGCNEHWFLADDNHITSDYGDYGQTYKYNVKRTTQSQEIVKFVRLVLRNNGLIK